MFTKHNLVFPMPEDGDARYLREVIRFEGIFLQCLGKEANPIEAAYAAYVSRVKAGAPLVEIEGMAQVIRYIEKLPYMARKDFLCTICDDLESAARGVKKERDETVFTFSDGTTQTVNIHGTLTKDHYTIPSEQQLTGVAIGRNITVIGGRAFSGCESLASVTIPDNVITIGNQAFSNCYSLTSVDIPNSVEIIRRWAFENCISLTSINIPNSIKEIEDSTFPFCDSLASITIPDSVIAIGANAFYNCKSASLVAIPSSVISIGDNALYNVPHISYLGSSLGAPWGAKIIN